MKRLFSVAVLGLALAGCETTHVDTDIGSTRSTIAQQLHLATEQVLFARHVNWALIPNYAIRPLVRGQIPAGFSSAIFVQTRSEIYLLPLRLDIQTAPILTVPVSQISSIAVQNMTTSLTREHLEQLQFEFAGNLLALTCSDSSDRIGGSKEETQAAYRHLVDAGLHESEPHPWVIQRLQSRIPITL